MATDASLLWIDRTDFAVCIYIKGLEDMAAQLKQLLFELGGNSWAHLVDDDDDLASLSDL